MFYGGRPFVKRTSGKGKGRRKNPRGSDGNIMKCNFPGCNSEDHFWKDCPMRRAQENTHLTIPPSAQQPVTVSISNELSRAGPMGDLLFTTVEAPGSTPNTEQSYATTLPATPPVPYRGTENRGEWELPMQVPWHNQLADTGGDTGH